MTRQRVLLTGVLLAILLLALALPAAIAQMPTPTPNLETQVWQEFTQTAQVTVSPNYTATLEALRTEAVLTLTAAVTTPTPGALASGAGAFAVTLNDNNQPSDIFLVDAASGTLTQLISNPQGDLSPSWSPDGSRLAYQSLRGDTGGIFVRDLSSGEEWQLSRSFEMRPLWSPDGAWILMEGVQGDNTDLFLVAADCYQRGACEPRNLTADNAIDMVARWSPDGQRIAYLTDRGERQDMSISLIRPDGSDKRPLLDPDQTAIELNWSPDGTRIAYTSDKSIYTADATCAETALTDVFSSRPLGCATDIRRLKQHGVDGDVFGLPVWSPDGTRIAYVSQDGIFLHIMNADGSNAALLLQQPVPIVELSWSPDGRQIAFVTGVGDLHLTDVVTGVPRTLVSEWVHLASPLVWQPGR